MTPNLQNSSPEIDICGYSAMRIPTSSKADVEPLASDTKSGDPYRRRPAVEEQLRDVLLGSHSEWMRDAYKYYPETLVRLILVTRTADAELCAALLAELAGWIVRFARKATREWDPGAAEEIIATVRFQVLRRLLTEDSSRKTEFLEVSFAEAIAGYTAAACKAAIKIADKRGYVFAGAVDDDGDEIERPMELLPSDYASPEETVIDLRKQEQVQALLDTAAVYLKDPRCLQAVILHVVEGIPVTSNDPQEDTLTGIFDATIGQIQHMLKAGMRALRRAVKELGVTE